MIIISTWFSVCNKTYKVELNQRSYKYGNKFHYNVIFFFISFSKNGVSFEIKDGSNKHYSIVQNRLW